MSPARNKLALRFTAAAITAAGAALVLIAAIGPISFDAPAAGTSAATRPSLTTQPTTEAVDLTDLLDIDLHRPLVDVKAPATLPTAADADLLRGLRLVGTVIEPQHSYAVFSNAAGKTEMKTVGEPAGGGTLIAITVDSVTLRTNGQSIILHTVLPASLGQLRS